MDKGNAVRILEETFGNQFDTARYLSFIKNILKHFQVNEKTSDVWDSFRDYVDSYMNYGSYVDSKKRVIDILCIKLKRTGSVDRARTMQRNFVAKYLDNGGKDAALVAFYGDELDDWRFSFVKMEYRLSKGPDESVNPVKELTPAKRYSFLVGVNEPNYTCRSQFAGLLMQDDINPALEEIEAAFSIDKVTKEFFIKYKGLYIKLKEAVEEFIKKDKNIREEFEDKAISTVDFTKKLMGQIVFIYFLQKKGWLGVEKDKGKFKDWGTGPKNFLRKLFEKKNYKNFFNDVLEPLFYEALATERDDDYYSRFECKIPFLNGGLFEPMNEYNWRETDLLLNNSIFSEILDTFDQYNFTVKEDEPLEKEVAIDPEMLGKVFENLIEENIRKGQGAYYTPREIVHYMCQQSLINYLETNTGFSLEDIEKFIQLGDFAIDEEQKILIELEKKRRKYREGIINKTTYEKESQEILNNSPLPSSIRENYVKIDELLKNIKIVDPAVGSGAFPVGMMIEIVKARSILSIFFSDEEQKERTNYALKREVIENCLYGVDIDSSAVDIAKLRFWLSLIVDELDMKNIKPLPNLDHKIMCGNSLLEEFEGHRLFDDKLLGEAKKDYSLEIKQIDAQTLRLNEELHQIHTGKIKNHNGRSKEIVNEIKKLQRKKEQILSAPKEQVQQVTIGDSLQKRIKESQKKLKELRELHQKFFNEQNRKLKRQYRDDIERIEWELIEETLKEQGDETAIKKLEQYKKNKSKPFFLWKLYFSEVFQRENPGFDVVIGNPPYDVIYSSKQPDYFLIYKKNYTSAEYNPNLFAMFIDKSVDLLKQKGVLGFIIPDTLLTNQYFKNIRRKILDNCHILEILDLRSGTFENAIVDNIIIRFEKGSELKEDITIGYGIDSSKDLENNNLKRKLISQRKFLDSNNNEFNIYFDDNLSTIKEKMFKNSVILGDISKIYRGIVSWDNKKYVVNKKMDDQFKPLIIGKDATRYYLKYSGHYIQFDKDGVKTGGDKNIYEADEKIIIALITGGMEYRINVAYDNNQFYVLQNYNNLIITDKKFKTKYILALLNSRLINDYYEMFFNDKNIKRIQLQQIPIAIIPEKEQNLIIHLVDQILSITKDDDYLNNPTKQSKVKKLEKEIDQLVYKLYELTPEEIKLIEEFNEEK